MATAKVATKVPASFERCEPGSVNIPVHKFQGSGSQHDNPESIADETIKAFNDALAKEDVIAVANLFLDDSYWRDHLALSWDFHTLIGKAKVQDFLQQNECALKSIEADKSSDFRKSHVGNFDGVGEVKGIEFFFNFKTKSGSGRGTCRLSEASAGKWLIFSMFTSLESLTGHEEAVFGRRPQGVEHGGKPDRKNWLERRQAEANYDEGREPTVIILGEYDQHGSSRLLTTVRCWPGRTHICSPSPHAWCRRTDCRPQ